MPVEPHAVADVAAGLANYLEWLKEEDVSRVDVSPKNLAALRQQPPLVPVSPAQFKPERAPAQPPIVKPTRPRPHPMSGTDDEVTHQLGTLALTLAACKQCALHQSRAQVVSGQGLTRQPLVMFVGESPGEEEDQQGVAFVGEAGRLLTRIIEAMGLRRDEVFLTNIIKCRPPNSRHPRVAEMERCLPYLRRQIALIRPQVIVVLGSLAAKALLNPTEPISQLRGRWLEFDGIPLMPTFHPNYLLHTPSKKMEVWADMKQVLSRLGRSPPARAGHS